MSVPVHPTFKKLNFSGQSRVVVVNAPDSFKPVMEEMQPFTSLATDLEEGTTFVLAFCTRQAEVDAFAAQCSQHTLGDAVVWVAYPKGTSKRYHCDFNRDRGWQAFGAIGFEPVRQVAIDEDWSALRLRRVEFIKSMRRAGAISAEGQKRVEERQKKNPAG